MFPRSCASSKLVRVGIIGLSHWRGVVCEYSAGRSRGLAMVVVEQSTDALAPLRVGQPQSSTLELLAEDAILLTEIVDQIVLMTVKPASDGEHEEVQGMGHTRRLSVRAVILIKMLGRVLAPYEVAAPRTGRRDKAK